MLVFVLQCGVPTCGVVLLLYLSRRMVDGQETDSYAEFAFQHGVKFGKPNFLEH
jgi:hypothetical protein